MATPFNTAIRKALKHVNKIKGATGAAQQTAYLTSPLTTTQVASPVINLDFARDAVIDAHGRLALEIASVADPVTGIGCHPWRTFFAGLTSAVTHGAVVPTATSGSKAIIGALGRPYDSSDTDQFLQPASLERVSKFKNNSSIYTNNPWFYSINGSKVYHTTTSIIFECCGYERSDIATAASAATNGSFGQGGTANTIPDVLEDALVAGAVVMMCVEGEYLDLIGLYAEYWKQALDAIRMGSLRMPGIPEALRMAA